MEPAARPRLPWYGHLREPPAVSRVTVARVTYSYVLVNALVSAITARNRNQPPPDPL
jgi:hypothetical protein